MLQPGDVESGVTMLKRGKGQRGSSASEWQLRALAAEARVEALERMESQLENVRAEKEQLEYLIECQRDTMHRIESDGTSSAGRAALAAVVAEEGLVIEEPSDVPRVLANLCAKLREARSETETAQAELAKAREDIVDVRTAFEAAKQEGARAREEAGSARAAAAIAEGALARASAGAVAPPAVLRHVGTSAAPVQCDVGTSPNLSVQCHVATSPRVVGQCDVGVSAEPALHERSTQVEVKGRLPKIDLSRSFSTAFLDEESSDGSRPPLPPLGSALASPVVSTPAGAASTYVLDRQGTRADSVVGGIAVPDSEVGSPPVPVGPMSPRGDAHSRNPLFALDEAGSLSGTNHLNLDSRTAEPDVQALRDELAEVQREREELQTSLRTLTASMMDRWEDDIVSVESVGKAPRSMAPEPTAPPLTPPKMLAYNRATHSAHAVNELRRVMDLETARHLRLQGRARARAGATWAVLRQLRQDRDNLLRFVEMVLADEGADRWRALLEQTLSPVAPGPQDSPPHTPRQVARRAAELQRAHEGACVYNVATPEASPRP